MDCQYICISLNIGKILTLDLIYGHFSTPTQGNLISLSFYLYVPVPLLSLLSFCPFVSLSLCLFVFLSLSMCLFVYLSFCLFVYLSICLFVYLPICLFVSLSFCLFVSLPFCLFVSLSLCKNNEKNYWD